MSHERKADARAVELAAKALASALPSTVAPVGDRWAAIAAIERALESRARRRIRSRFVAVVPLAAGVAAVLAMWLWQGDGREKVADQVAGVAGEQIGGQAHRVDRRPSELTGAALAGGRVVGPRTLELGGGSRVRLLAASGAVLSRQGGVQRIVLEEGGLTAAVTKLGPDERFLVVTPDAEIEVRGTRFDVQVLAQPGGCGSGSRTQVRVQEGLVSVRHGQREVHVGAGGMWPECEEPPPSIRGVAAARPVGTAAPAARRARMDRTAAPPAPPAASLPASSLPASSLTEQNDLFAAALRAGRRGDAVEALRWLDQLLRRHPDGQLAESARAERRRLQGGVEGQE